MLAANTAMARFRPLVIPATIFGFWATVMAFNG